jgi:hypothetical protein
VEPVPAQGNARHHERLPAEGILARGWEISSELPIGELPTDIFTPNRKGRAMAAGHRTGLVSTHVDRPKQ